MDESFLIRARRMLGEAGRPRPDHASLVAHASARQTATPTARLAAAQASPQTGASDAAATLIRGADGWRSARAAQAGCFNRAVAARGRNVP